MSKIGKKLILIPEGVKVILKDQEIFIEGPLGKLSQKILSEIFVKIEDNKIIVAPKIKSKKSSAFWGLTRVLLQNCIIGVTSGFEKKLEIHGIGYKASLEDENILKLEVGFSHPVKIEIPTDIKVTLERDTLIIVSGIDKQKIGEFAAKIRKIKLPEPYKGKGIRYVGEVIRRKAGKKAGSVR